MMSESRGNLIKVAAASLTVSMIGIANIGRNEDGPKGPILTAYPDAGGVVTACGGIVRKGFTVGQKFTPGQCQIMLREAVSWEQKTVQRLVTVPVTQRQFDALVDVVHNAGSGAFARAKWLPVLNAGQCRKAGQMLLTWRATVKGKPNKGVANRRKWESTEWLTGCD